MSLYFRCRSCGEEHDSPIGFGNQSAFERTHLISNSFQCPATGNYARYRKRDLYWKLDTNLAPVAFPADSNLSVRGTDLAEARLLAIDDQRPMLMLWEQLFQRAGYCHVATNTDPLQCVDLVDSFRPDLIVLDLHMPDLDGTGVLERIHSRIGPDDFLPVLVVTGNVEPESRRRALIAGANDFLNKPFDHVEALLRIRNLLQIRLLHARLQRYTALLEQRLHPLAAPTAGG